MKEDQHYNSDCSSNSTKSLFFSIKSAFDNDSSDTLLPSSVPGTPTTVVAVGGDYGAIASVDALQADRPGYGTSSTTGSCMNLVNAMMGSGIIGLPLALHMCGLWMGLLCSVGVAILTGIAMHLLVLCGIRSRQYTMADLARVSLLGTWGSHLVNFLMVFHTAGTAVSYYILLGDMLPELFDNYGLHWLADRRLSVVSFGLFCSLPLSLPRSIAPLAKWSTFNVMLLPLVLLGVFIRMPKYATEPPVLDWTWPANHELFKGLAILGLSFGCSQNVFGVYLSQRDQRPSQFLLADTSSLLIGYTINMLFGIMGFLCFGNKIQANVLLNFPNDDPVINIVRLLFGVFMVFTIPMSIYPCRESLQKLLGYNTDGRIPTNKEHYGTTAAVFTIVLSLGATLTELGKVFAVIGGFSTTALGLLLPGAAYAALFLPELIMPDKNGNHDESIAVTTTPIVESSHDHNSCSKFAGAVQYPVSASWALMISSFILILVSFPIMYFAILEAL
ncbi:transmembrane amino acid transporter protein-domain-containing protein [Zychaea mexicana]|uniref:transmembrane amino acid transporter protein-domain-containing protein n=1 Tax=Zychaea mexicana TaxID=64656 RepID=UPI0022FE22D2|nr:transmembrane amino acid transporter protein-domain-containing protein [Zychaea mexicana]KAI9489588.1 transmembrane amino acid transporter protein-domain-containing protein [Zychaea mexicana]